MDAALPIQKAAQALAPVADKPHYQYTHARKGNASRSSRATCARAFAGSVLNRAMSRPAHRSAYRGPAALLRPFPRVRHQQGTGQPFLRPAFEAKKDDALRIFKDRLATRIEKQRQIAAARTDTCDEHQPRHRRCSGFPARPGERVCMGTDCAQEQHGPQLHHPDAVTGNRLTDLDGYTGHNQQLLQVDVWANDYDTCAKQGRSGDPPAGSEAGNQR